MLETMKYGFIDPFSVECMNLVCYHDMSMVVVAGVMVLVSMFLFAFFAPGIFLGGYSCMNATKHNTLEILWTTVPGVFLCVLAYVSWVNLYMMEVGVGSDYHAKVVGRQWYWEYEYYADGLLLNFMKGWSDLKVVSSLSSWLGSFGVLFGFYCFEEVGVLGFEAKNLSVGMDAYNWAYPAEYQSKEAIDVSFLPFSRRGSADEVFFVPVSKTTEVSISTGDVIHSWGVPGLGVKMDAVPGRTNHVSLDPVSVGFVSGNCYELCGYGHSVMPISVGILSEKGFTDYLSLKGLLSGS
uniref:cytochrome c oxidase subunit II n=1 Tax=Xylophaga oregona TaxID=2584329 RepID=UPI00202864BB|nr:cytochrome c oxidase subunit II [Xylophaga oregona]UPX88899.1 cytochrome c oxidase subunit 2 [Xylophaga oregona]UPX88911.1 cytochrome c oxidase subunit 2 [Xylophaga oregona]UPX88923.1 cytochrome c oxidase subunit 2 [Xylophaga oregona]UPX88935.1 cytochrome c oxidase subunit 2 [Xylophaga oregona]